MLIGVHAATFFGDFRVFNQGSQQSELHIQQHRGLQDLNIFNFFYVDDHVAVAQGASGSVALWGATDAQWDEEHLVPVEGEAEVGIK